MLNVKQANVLTEEELNKLEREFWVDGDFGSRYFPSLEYLFTSHRTLNSRNAKLVHENDELMAENEKLKSALSGIVNGGWSSYLDDDKLRVWQTDRINPKQIALDALEELNHE